MHSIKFTKLTQNLCKLADWSEFKRRLAATENQELLLKYELAYGDSLSCEVARLSSEDCPFLQEVFLQFNSSLASCVLRLFPSSGSELLE